tara:strand:+ start:90 stop:410 length:321 start_codon:yes stop_codon:yes gene_type:complete
MRRAACGSIFLSALAALSVSSICQAKIALYVVQGKNLFCASLDALHDLVSQIGVFQIFDMLFEGFADVERFRAPGKLGKPGQALVKRVVGSEIDHLGHVDGILIYM